MKHFFVLAALSIFSFSATAEIIDTGQNRSFLTQKGQCKLTMPRGDFVIGKEQIKFDGTTVYYNNLNEKKLINFSFYIDTASKVCADSEKCLDMALTNRLYEKAKDMKKYERNGFSVAEFIIELPAKENTSIIQKNLLAEKYRDGCWVDIHISQLGIDAPDVKNILPLIDNLSIE